MKRCSEQRGFIGPDDFFWFLVMLVAVGFVAGLVVAFGVPWIWSIMKPWLHAITG